MQYNVDADVLAPLISAVAECYEGREKATEDTLV